MKNTIIVLITIIIFIRCSNKQTEKQESKEESKEVINENSIVLTDTQAKNAKIQTSKIYKKTIAKVLTVNGIIDVPPQNMVSISVPLGGYLISTKLLEGMHVRKGEIIAVMQDQQYIQLQQDYLSAKIHLNAIKKEFDRQKELNQSKASSDKVFENAQAEYLSQKILIKSLSEKLKLIHIEPKYLNENTISRSIKIYSPIDGFVTSIKMNIGKYASPTDVLFELVNPTDIHLALTIFEKDLDKIFIGQNIIAYNNIKSEKKYNCKVILIGKNVSAERALTVHCHFEKYAKTLIPGMYMNAEIEVAPQNAFIIPDDGLVGFAGKEYVFIQNEKNTYTIQEVYAQNSENGFTQISFTDNTMMSEKIFVIKGAYTLLMCMKNTQEE